MCEPNDLGTVQKCLERVLASRAFRLAELQRKFLQYAVQETLGGNGHHIKEYVIATQGLGRDESFDPRLDPIVRTEARKLRARLAKYYETEGADDPVRIEFPKGSYAPCFRKVEPNLPAPDDLVPISTITAPAAMLPNNTGSRRPTWFRIAASALCVVLLATGVAALRSGPEQLHFAAGSHARPDSYRDYRRGRHFLVRFTPDGVDTAVSYFEKAIHEDPSFGRAYAGLADSYLMQPQILGAPPREVISKAKTAAVRALELDPTLGEAHFDLAVCAEYEFDWAKAEAEFRRGLELTPDNAVGHLWYAKYLAIQGRKSAVLTHRRIAAELDPVSAYALQSVAGYFSVTGRYDEAIERFRDALAIEPRFGLSHQGLGLAYLLKGMHPEALSELKAATELMQGPRTTALLGYAYAVSGQPGEAQRILDTFLDRFRREPFPALPIALVYIGLGDKDRAFEWLEKAIEQRDLDVTLQWDSPYEFLRGDPRYLKLLRRMKLI